MGEQYGPGSAGFGFDNSYDAYWVRLDAFLDKHPRLHCPACHKRVSPDMDTVGCWFPDMPVRLVCPHCHETSEIPE